MDEGLRVFLFISAIGFVTTFVLVWPRIVDFYNRISSIPSNLRREKLLLAFVHGMILVVVIQTGEMIYHNVTFYFHYFQAQRGLMTPLLCVEGVSLTSWRMLTAMGSLSER